MLFNINSFKSAGALSQSMYVPPPLLSCEEANMNEASLNALANAIAALPLLEN